MTPKILGIHHVTAISGDPQQNVDFYVGVLGLRMVKRTVNFDDPGTYHLYYGDDVGHPGTIMTFFPWPGAPRGRIGVGQVTMTAFSIPGRAVGFWQERLRRYGIAVEGPKARFDEEVLAFEDPDGLPLELVAADNDPRTGWRDGPIPEAYAIRGFHGVTVSEQGLDEGGRRTLELLGEGLGFRQVGEAGTRFRLAAGGGAPGTFVDVLCLDGAPYGETAVGTVHHVAWRTPDDTHQRTWQERITHLGLRVTDVRDRQYFRSIYFREPGGVLFEIATDPPGFVVDESPAQLGMRLMLPPWLEPRRAELERSLLPLVVPEITRTAG